MYKMMIVDDERLIREGLSKLNWKQYGIRDPRCLQKRT